MLDIDGDKFLLALLLSAAAGAVGGLISELLLQRGRTGRSGVLLFPERRGRTLDLGSCAAIIIGAGAGILAMALLVPAEDVKVGDDTQRQVDALRAIGATLAAGAAGQAFWGAIKKGMTEMDYKARLESVLATLKPDDGTAGGSQPENVHESIILIESALEDLS